MARGQKLSKLAGRFYAGEKWLIEIALNISVQIGKLNSVDNLNGSFERYLVRN